jgi:hypothetical protein
MLRATLSFLDKNSFFDSYEIAANYYSENEPMLVGFSIISDFFAHFWICDPPWELLD